MNKNILFCLSFLLLVTVKAGAQDSFSVRAQRYIDQYYTLAIAEQQRSGIPASVTLAQGVLETEAGKSELACAANNHFGIKCKSDYQGEKFFHDDDAPQECFKMYKCAEDSYKDHSDYLKRNKRYSPLFALSQTDYASWAVCLRKCGYATNPQYAQRLIKIIEDFKLQQYTYAAMDSSLLPNQPVVLKNSVPLHDVPTKPVVAAVPVATVAAPDTSKKIILTTFDPAPANKQVAAARSKPVMADTVKKTMQPVAQTVPVAEVPKTVEVEQPVVAGNSFTEIRKIADSTHHIITNDGPMVPQANADMPGDTSTAQGAIGKQAQASIDTKYDSGKVITVNGLKAFYAYKGEMLLQYAVRYNVRYPHLLEINDLDDKPLENNMPVYLEKKLSSGTHAKHTVKEGESMFLIAQAEGLQLKRLLALNMMDIGDEPATGVILELQNGVFRKPALRAVYAEPKSNTTIMLGKSTPPSDYIAVPKPKPVVVKVVEPVKEVAAVPVVKEAPVTEKVKAEQYVETIATGKQDSSLLVAAVATEPAPVKVIPATPAPVKVVTPEPTPVKTVAAAPVVATPVAAKVEPAVVKTPDTAAKEDTVVDELANLKAELDKVVYTDDSKLMQANPVKPTVVKPAVKPEVKKADAKHKAKKGDDDDDDDDDKGGNMYTIKQGETLGGIANRHNTTVKKLMQLNHIKATDIRAGKKLRVK